MKKQEFSPHQPTHSFPYSRDFEDIDCSAVSCVYNNNKKCTVPSLAKIGVDGRCTGFLVASNVVKDVINDIIGEK